MRSIFAIFKLSLASTVVILLVWLVWSLFFGSYTVSTHTTVSTVSVESAVKDALENLKTDTVILHIITLDADIEGKRTLEIQGGLLGKICPDITLEGRVKSKHAFGYNSGEVAKTLKLVQSSNGEVEFDLELGVPQIILSVPEYFGTDGKVQKGTFNYIGSFCHSAKGLEEEITKMINELAENNANAGYQSMVSAIENPMHHQNFGKIVFNYWAIIFSKMGIKATVNFTFNTGLNAPAEFLKEVKAKTYKVTITNRNGKTEVRKPTE